MSTTSIHGPRFRVLLRVTAGAALMAHATGCDDFQPPPSSSTPAQTRDAAAPGGGEPSGDAGAPSPSASIDASLPASAVVHAPAVGSHAHVLVPNPREQGVAVVALKDLKVAHVKCAQSPLLLAAQEDRDLALAVDTERAVACAIDLGGEVPLVTELPVVAHANRARLAPDARHAIVYHDRTLALRDGGAAVDTVEISVLSLVAPAQSHGVTVGLHPREVAFSADGTVAVVTSDAGLSVVPLSEAAAGKLLFAPAVAWQGGPQPEEAVVRVSADAGRAVAFEPDSPQLRVFDLHAESSQVLDLEARDVLGTDSLDAGFEAAPPRIADLALNRAGDRVYLALRGEQKWLDVPLPAALAPDFEFTVHDLAGQHTDRLALAASDEDTLLVLSDSDGRATLQPIGDDGPARQVPLVGPTDTVLGDPNGLAFVLLHAEDDDHSGTYTVVRAEDGFVRLSKSVGAPPMLVLAATGGTLAAVVHEGDAGAHLELLELGTFATTSAALDGKPVATGFGSDGRFAFVQLEHPDGRIEIFDLSTGRHRSATGLLIADRVRK